MKKVILGTTILLFTVLISCNKSTSTGESDEIIFEQINKTITFSNTDSISGTCKYLIFEVEMDREALYSANIKTNNVMIACDGSNNILVESPSENILSLDGNYEISQAADWDVVSKLNLDAFAGQGENFIGYRASFFPDGVTNYHYGWIKINLSENEDTLEIISRATNYTNNKLIFSRQLQ